MLFPVGYIVPFLLHIRNGVWAFFGTTRDQGVRKKDVNGMRVERNAGIYTL